MDIELTTPTKITEEQYKAGYFAINRENADHWFINEHDDIRLYVGNSPESLSQSYSDMMKEELNAEINGVTVVDGYGNDVEIEAITYGTEHSYNNLDLNELAEGKISWK